MVECNARILGSRPDILRNLSLRLQIKHCAHTPNRLVDRVHALGEHAQFEYWRGGGGTDHEGEDADGCERDVRGVVEEQRYRNWGCESRDRKREDAETHVARADLVGHAYSEVPVGLGVVLEAAKGRRGLAERFDGGHPLDVLNRRRVDSFKDIEVLLDCARLHDLGHRLQLTGDSNDNWRKAGQGKPDIRGEHQDEEDDERGESAREVGHLVGEECLDLLDIRIHHLLDLPYGRGVEVAHREASHMLCDRDAYVADRAVGVRMRGDSSDPGGCSSRQKPREADGSPP